MINLLSLRVTYKILEILKLTLHPDKTFIGKISRGFDYLGCHIEPMGARLSTACTFKAATKAHQLYEQTRDEERVRQYWKRFLRWGEDMVTMAAGLRGRIRTAGEDSSLAVGPRGLQSRARGHGSFIFFPSLAYSLRTKATQGKP